MRKNSWARKVARQAQPGNYSNSKKQSSGLSAEETKTLDALGFVTVAVGKARSGEKLAVIGSVDVHQAVPELQKAFKGGESKDRTNYVGTMLGDGNKSGKRLRPGLLLMEARGRKAGKAGRAYSCSADNVGTCLVHLEDEGYDLDQLAVTLGFTDLHDMEQLLKTLPPHSDYEPKPAQNHQPDQDQDDDDPEEEPEEDDEE